MIAERSDLLPDPVMLLAPDGALGWSPGGGFLLSVDALTDAHIEGAPVIAVRDGLIEVEGLAPLASLIRADRDITLLRQRVAALEAAV